MTWPDAVYGCVLTVCLTSILWLAFAPWKGRGR